MSAIGTLQTFQLSLSMSAFGGTADIRSVKARMEDSHYHPLFPHRRPEGRLHTTHIKDKV